MEEARFSKKYWSEFGEILPSYFTGRKPHNKDILNYLLDIGYHHLTNITKSLLVKYKIPSDLGLLHIARNTGSSPLAYDLVEMFRADIVDAEVLKFFRLKKQK